MKKMCIVGVLACLLPLRVDVLCGNIAFADLYIHPIKKTEPHTHLRVKRWAGIPDDVTWEQVHKQDKYRKLLANKLKELGLRVEKRHR